jgi:hypothetical protein
MIDLLLMGGQWAGLKSSKSCGANERLPPVELAVPVTTPQGLVDNRNLALFMPWLYAWRFKNYAAAMQHSALLLFRNVYPEAIDFRRHNDEPRAATHRETSLRP